MIIRPHSPGSHLMTSTMVPITFGNGTRLETSRFSSISSAFTTLCSALEEMRWGPRSYKL